MYGAPVTIALVPEMTMPLRVALDDVHVAVGVGLLVRPLAAVALGVGHRDAERSGRWSWTSCR